MEPCQDTPGSGFCSGSRFLERLHAPNQGVGAKALPQTSARGPLSGLPLPTTILKSTLHLPLFRFQGRSRRHSRLPLSYTSSSSLSTLPLLLSHPGSPLSYLPCFLSLPLFSPLGTGNSRSPLCTPPGGRRFWAGSVWKWHITILRSRSCAGVSPSSAKCSGGSCEIMGPFITAKNEIAQAKRHYLESRAIFGSC